MGIVLLCRVIVCGWSGAIYIYPISSIIEKTSYMLFDLLDLEIKIIR